MKKYVFIFSHKKSDGHAKMSSILGGKGANLAEMSNLSIPVPPGFTISTEVCTYYMKHKKYPVGLKTQVNDAIKYLEKYMGKNFGSPENPLLLSVRSGARQSMPGMMETVLNIGLNQKTADGLINQTKNSKFVYDSLRRLMMMYSDVVMEKSKSDTIIKNGIRIQLEKILSKIKTKYNYKNDSDLNQDVLIELCHLFQKKIKSQFKTDFPENPQQQLWGAIDAVFQSWNGKRAIDYRNIENIPHTWGTAVNVQAMVFGNMGKNSGTGVAFTRNPATGENYFFGEWLPNAQGEDVVAGIRTPFPINNFKTNNKNSLETKFPKIYNQLFKIQKRLEKHYLDMQDIEFTIENNKLWLLQTRTGKRTGIAAITIALDLLKNKLINNHKALNRISSKHINELLHPTFNSNKLSLLKPIASGLPAGPGAAHGQVIFNPDDAEKLFKKGKKIILVREETSPEDVHGMFSSQAILTSHGGMTSHAALVARGWGKCCIVGCKEINIDYQKKIFTTHNNLVIKEFDWISLNGSEGTVFLGKLPLKKPNLHNNTIFKKLLSIAYKNSNIKVRTNSDTVKDAKTALKLNAQGIGLCRTEHMFFNPNRIKEMRKMILESDSNKKHAAIMRLLPFQQSDFYKILKSMNNYPVTIRLLDPPLHEFLPSEEKQINRLAKDLKTTSRKLKQRIESLKESNPMLGHRGCRLGITFPIITKMQAQAIALAAIRLKKANLNPKPEIMVPLVGSIGEFLNQKNIIKDTFESLLKEAKCKLNYKIGTMIELPRACLITNQIAQHADFISFGTNDLTQTTFGFSRDDIGSFLPEYLNNNILYSDPFQHIDEEGVGKLISIAIKDARKINPNIKIGICGEHGGDAQSIKYLAKSGINYVSCSPFRVPIAYLALSQLVK
tara:strand:- start:1799 stop:4480 length:2682 start_codon:yes stop_codon:yes gene_type:complete